MNPEQPAAPPEDVTALRGIELIYYGHMGLTADADAILSRSGYGRAHYRALYVIARHPGIIAGALLARLKITSQSLTRVMGQLVRDGMVLQQADAADRRHRRHRLSDAGAGLEQRVRLAQFATLKRAYQAAGERNVEGFLCVLQELVPAEDRKLLTFPPSDRAPE